MSLCFHHPHNSCIFQLSVMTDLYIKELEEKVAHYEAIMSRCPQCKTTLAIPEAESTTAASRHSRSRRSAQQLATKAPPPAITGASKGPTPASTVSSSARSSKQLQPASQTELRATALQQIPPAASSNRGHQTTAAPVSIAQHPELDPPDHPTTGSVTSSTKKSLGQPTTTSQTLSARPSSLALSNSDGRHRHSGTVVELDLQPKRPPKPRNQLPRRAEWMRTADIMLEEVPYGRHWRLKLSRMDSSIIAAVAVGIAPAAKRNVSLTEDVERIELIRLVRRFAERNSEGRVNFEHLILVCLCKVLSSQGVAQDTIVETLQICISDTSRRNIDRYIKGVLWANKIMNDLFFTDWGLRAVDLIAICRIFGKPGWIFY